MDEFKELFENSVLNDETKAALSEAWNSKLETARKEIREEVEADVRNEFKDRYENDKGRLYEAMDQMLSDAVQKYSSDMIEESIRLKEEKEKLAVAVKESRNIAEEKIASNMKMFEQFVADQLREKITLLSEEKKKLEKDAVDAAKKEARSKEAKKQKMKETIDHLNTFVLSKLSEEINKLREKENELAQAKVEVKESLRAHKISLNEETAARINKLEEFILNQLKSELVEFKNEKDSLATLRVKMVKESKDNLNKTRLEFVKRASSLIENTISSRLEEEITSLKESITEARNNQLGQKMFETFQDVFMASYLAEGTKFRKVENELEKVKNELNESKKINASQEKLIESKDIRIKLSEERVLRTKTMQNLLRPLNKDKRETMESLLETVKTSDLDKAFHKYLNVLNEEVKPKVNTKLLTETKAKPAPAEAIEVTGNKTLINESVISDENKEAEELRAYLRRTAGIKN